MSTQAQRQCARQILLLQALIHCVTPMEGTTSLISQDSDTASASIPVSDQTTRTMASSPTVLQATQVYHIMGSYSPATADQSPVFSNKPTPASIDNSIDSDFLLSERVTGDLPPFQKSNHAQDVAWSNVNPTTTSWTPVEASFMISPDIADPEIESTLSGVSVASTELTNVMSESYYEKAEIPSRSVSEKSPYPFSTVHSIAHSRISTAVSVDGSYSCGSMISFRCKEENEFQILPCACDKYCLIYDNCCPNFATFRPEVHQEALRIKSQHDEVSTTCLPSAHKAVVSNCPASATAQNASLAKLCTSEPRLSDVNSIPVTNNVTGLSFANTYCALCHGSRLETLVTWQGLMTPGAFSSMTHDLKQAFDDAAITETVRSRVRLGKDESDFFWVPRRFQLESSRDCITNAIATCPEVNGTQHHLSHSCHTGPIAYTFTGRPGVQVEYYKNPACYACNTYRHNSEPCQPAHIPNVFIRSTDFSNLLKYNPPLRSVGFVLADNDIRTILPWRVAMCSFADDLQCQIVKCLQAKAVLFEGVCYYLTPVFLSVNLQGDLALWWQDVSAAGNESSTLDQLCNDFLSSFVKEILLKRKHIESTERKAIISTHALQCTEILRVSSQPPVSYEDMVSEAATALKEALIIRNMTGVVRFCVRSDHASSDPAGSRCPAVDATYHDLYLNSSLASPAASKGALPREHFASALHWLLSSALGLYSFF